MSFIFLWSGMIKTFNNLYKYERENNVFWRNILNIIEAFSILRLLYDNVQTFGGKDGGP